ncbi:MAG: response regulator transcription factor [Rhodopila sp.]|nr:response regulator transcription factor [Rhodopila sp.]
MEEGVATDRRRKVLIADPQPTFRLGIVALLASAHPDWDIVEADTLEEHRLQLEMGAIDLLILEGQLLGTEFVQGAPIRARMSLAVDIIAVTEPGDAVGALGCLAAGAHATISRSDPTVRVLTMIETMTTRRRHDGALRVNHDPSAAPPAEIPQRTEVLNLTARQLDVLRLLAKGQSNKVIARDLGLSVSTVKVHLNTVFRALGARNRVEAVVRARPFQAGMIPHGR